MTDTGGLLVISGPYGSGKSTVVHEIVDRYPGAYFSISATTRAPRGEERDGVDYYFISEEAFLEKVRNGDMLEWANYCGRYYGTPEDAVREHLEKGHLVVLEIDVQGALQIKEKMPEAVLVFVMPPSYEELEKRLRARATESEEAVQKRLLTGKSEMEKAVFYDYIVINDTVEAAVSEIIDIIGR